jgi:epidermal growth factor receptor substrate 15
LLGEDAADESTQSVPDNSAEIGNKRNQLENTQRSLSTLETTRAGLEKSDKSNASQLAELETSLSTARSRHEEETKAVADLRSRVSDQQEKIKNMNMDFIAAESDLSAMRSEKDELEQALLRDKEEIRGLQKKMREADEEKTTLKNLLEKLKKETRQQKGMVSIAKKQLSTSEGNRDGAQKDLDDHHKNAIEVDDDEEDRGFSNASAAGLGALGGAALGGGAIAAFGQGQGSGVTSPFEQSRSPVSPDAATNTALPITPQALSPMATGASSRSNNPFDRLRTQSRGPAPPPPQVPSPSQSQSPPAASSPALARAASPRMGETSHEDEEPRSPGDIATGALVGAGTAIGLAAGVAVAGAAAVFGAAKEAVVGEDHEPEKSAAPEAATGIDAEKTPTAEESDPFGGPASAETAPRAQASEAETDVFGAPAGQTFSGFSTTTASDTDPFGAPTQRSFDDFDQGFGDSFAASAATTVTATDASKPVGNNADFDSAFDDFDDAPPSQVPVSEPATETFASPEQVTEHTIPSGIPKSALPDIRPDHERTDSTQAVAPESVAATPRAQSPVEPTTAIENVEPAAEPTEDLLSSDEEDDGPEDLEAPKRAFSSTRLPQEADTSRSASPLPTSAALAAPLPLASPVDTAPKGRRSAPPPPASKSSTGPAPAVIDDFDPFGAPASSVPITSAAESGFGALPPGAAPAQSQSTGPQTAKFDDDDFDFSDMPPAKVDDSEPPVPASTAKNTSAFDDEFAGFDDEFESVPTNPNSGSDRSNMSKSYEMVSPTQEAQQAPAAQRAPQAGGSFDEWGLGGQAAGTQQPPQPTSGFSFDDAFGGDFEPT